MPNGTRVSLSLKVEGGPENFCVATMTVGQSDTVTLDLNLEGYAEWTVVGHKSAVVHVSGYYVPTDGDDDEEISNGEDEEDDLRSMTREQLEELLAGGGMGDEGDSDQVRAPNTRPEVDNK